MKKKPTTYFEAGVDITAGDKLVSRIKNISSPTHRKGVIDSIGGFAGLLEVPAGYREPVLVSSTDGVGTKLKLALETKNFKTIGIDVVAMCVNDTIVCGAKPLFFLDYLACGKLSVETASSIIEGIAEGCIASECALLGGETAEMPGMYNSGDYDVAGFTVGIVEKKQIINGSGVRVGNVVLGIKSSGIHSNGYSLVRLVCERVFGKDYIKAVADYKIGSESDSLLDLLMRPTKIYVPCISQVISHNFNDLHSLAHITGGGPKNNIVRSIPTEFKVILERGNFPISPAMEWLKEEGEISDTEFFSVFNAGIGMTLIVEKDSVEKISAIIKNVGEEAVYLGEVVPRKESDAQIEIC